MRDIKDILKAWANSRIMNRMGTEYPAQTAILQGAPRSFDYRQYLTEEEASVVDNAVLTLKKIDEKQWAILTAYYLKRTSYRGITRATGVNSVEINKSLNMAESFVYGMVITKFYGDHCVDNNRYSAVC